MGERAKELGRPEPTDLSGACKFASLLGKEIFGLGIQGNWGHQFNVLPSGKPLDLLEGKAGEVGYLHDKEFFNNPEHRKSLESCKARVADWAKEFRQRYPLAGKTATQARWSSPLLDGLKAEARKAPTFEDFKYDFSIDIKHGMYFHVTKDPSFRIDSEKGPVDASSLASSDRMEKGKLMVTSHLDYWLAEYEGYRTYVAIIDMSDVPRNAYHQVSRGFGNEFMVTDPSQAKVQQVLPIAKAQRLDERHHAALDFASDDDLLEFYNLFHDPEAPQWKSPKEQGKLPFRGKGMTVAKLRPMRNDLLNLRNPTPEVLPPVDTDPYEAHRPLPDIGEMIGTPDRWYKDLGAIPGEALFTLDSDDENSEGKAAIVETDTEPVEYELYLPDGELLGMTGKPLDPLNTQSVQQLAERAEKYIDAHPGAGRPAIDIEAQPSTPPLLPAKEAGSFDEPFPDGRVDYFEEPQNPHSDREKEVGIDIAKDAASGRRTKILWLRYEDRIYSTPTTMRVLDHSQWLQNMSLPWFGPAYDAIERGTALADGRANRVYITRNGGGFAEQDVIEHLVSKYHLEGWDIREEDSNNLRMDASVKTASWSGLAYHGTMYGAPEVFQTEPEDIKRRSGVDINALLGAHFSAVKNVAKGFAGGWYQIGKKGRNPVVITAQLTFQNPMRVSENDLQEYINDLREYLDELAGSGMGQEWAVKDHVQIAREVKDAIEADGYDSIIYDNEVEGGISYIAFHPSQIRVLKVEKASSPLLQPKDASKTATWGDAVDFSSDPKWHDVFYGTPTPEGLKRLSSFLHGNPNQWITLYHGTDAELPIMEEGLLPTSAGRAKSMGSTPGFVYLSVFPGIAADFARLAYPGKPVQVYAVTVTRKRLQPDKDQLANKRNWGNMEVPDTLAASLAIGHGARVAGRVEPMQLSPVSKVAKVAVNEEGYYDLQDVLDTVAMEVLQDYASHLRRKNYHQAWRVVPAARLEKIWQDYSKTGFVRDEAGINEIADLIIENICKVEVNTILCGHTPYHPEEWAHEQTNQNYPEGYFERLDNFFDDPHSSTWRISDNALRPLTTYAADLITAKTSEDKLQLIDKVLSTVHPRGDVASWFVQGGRKTLTKMFKYRGDEEEQESGDEARWVETPRGRVLMPGKKETSPLLQSNKTAATTMPP